MILKKATYQGDYRIAIEFVDGSQKVYDFRKWLFEDCQPFYSRYKNLQRFVKFRIYNDKLSWGHGRTEMDFPIENLKEFEVTK